AGATEESRRSAFVTELKVFIDGAELYRAREGQHVPDGSSGECPEEFAPYVDADDFEAGTPIGGVWDTEFEESGITAAVGVHFMDPEDAKDDAYMLVIDALFDDGDLSTGLFRKLAEARYYAVVED